MSRRAAQLDASGVLTTAVVVATWEGNPPRYLRGLLESFERYDAGLLFRPFLVVNGHGYPLDASIAACFERVLERENTGFNLGAWDHAWRALGDCERFLFLQDDCFARRRNWLRDIALRFDRTPRCGLVGEQIQRNFDRPWSELVVARSATLTSRRVSASVAARARYYREKLREWGIHEGRAARHVTTVVQYTSREVLEDVGGYDLVSNYEDAIAAEIGFSCKLTARGYALAQVGRRRHARIGHREWSDDGFAARLRRSIEKRM